MVSSRAPAPPATLPADPDRLTAAELVRRFGVTPAGAAALIQELRRRKHAGDFNRAATLEHIPVAVTGRWRDVITYPDGRVETSEFVEENLVVNTFAILMCGVLITTRTPPYAGITHMALGDGDGAWTTNPPAPALTDTTLIHEVERRPVDSVVDCDALGNIVLTGPTGFLLVSCTFSRGDALFSIREMGLFGGVAAAGHTLDQPGQGLMVNHINHGLIVKSVSADFSLLRQVILAF